MKKLFTILLLCAAMATFLIGCSKTANTKYVTTVMLNQVNFLDSKGGAWDTDGSGPDIYFRFKRNNSSAWEYTSTTIADVKQSDLPFGFDFKDKNIILTDEKWDFEIWDADGFPATDERMASWTNVDATISAKDGNITLAGGGGTTWDIKVNYELR